MSFACCHISFTVLNTFKGKTSDVVIFEQITDPFRPFFLNIIKVTNFVFDHANPTRMKMKSS